MEKKYHHGNLKNELIDISFDFIKEEGINKLTLKMLAKKTGTSTTAIYRHFKSKEALMETLITLGLKKFDDYITAIFKAEDKNLLDRFFLSGKHYIRFATANANLYDLLFGSNYSDLKQGIVSIENNNWAGFSLLKSAVEEAQTMGLFRVEDSRKQAIIIWASLHGLSLLHINKLADINSSDILYKMMYENLLIGLMNEEGHALYKA